MAGQAGLAGQTEGHEGVGEGEWWTTGWLAKYHGCGGQCRERDV